MNSLIGYVLQLEEFILRQLADVEKAVQDLMKY